jgi:hypothetical protein
MDNSETKITIQLLEKATISVKCAGQIDDDMEQNIHHSISQILPLIIGLVEIQKARLKAPINNLEVGRRELSKLMIAEMHCYGLIAQAVDVLNCD